MSEREGGEEERERELVVIAIQPIESNHALAWEIITKPACRSSVAMSARYFSCW